MSGSRPLFSNAPITPLAPTLPVVAPGSNMALAMGMPKPLALQTPNTQVPLSTMLAIKNAMGQSAPTYGNPNGDPSMGANADPATLAAQAASTQQIGAPGAPIQAPVQGQAPGMPTTGAVGTPTMGSPGMPSAGIPGMPSPGSPGIASAGQPGQFGQISAWLQSLMGQGTPSAGGGGVGG